MRKLILSALIFLHSFCSNAQGIKGQITDENNQSIPNATIYIEEIQSGTTANVNGEYVIKLVPGKYSVSYKSLGYKTVKKELVISNTVVTANVSLSPEVYQLKEVTISSKGEDPAYAIMRKAIALAPFHLREVKYYESLVYLKGTIYIDKMPKLLSKVTSFEEGNVKIRIKTGDVYTEESILEIAFNAPRFYKRKVRSLRSSFPGNSSSPISPIVVIEASFYEPEIADMVSPLSPQAFQHYKFKYEGYSEDGGQIINKIKVVPKRTSQDLFSGYIYIVDNKWCLHSVDLAITQFWGTLSVRGMFGNVNKNTWLPVSYSFNVVGNMMGIKGRYKYVTSIKYTSVKMNDAVANMNPSAQIKPKATDNHKITLEVDKIAKTIAKDNLSNREMKKVSKQISEVSAKQRKDTLTQVKIKEMTKREVDTMAQKRDTAYWNDFRPVPLTAEEVKSFDEGPSAVIQKVKKDSVNLAKDTAYLTKKKNKMNPFWIVGGKTVKLKMGKSNIRYSGLLQPDQFNFNTVDGFCYGLKSNMWLDLDSGKWVKIQPWVGYAFNRKAFMWELKTDYRYKTHSGKWGALSFQIGHKSTDFNAQQGIHPFINSVYSLFFRENYMKLYDRKYVVFNNENDWNRFLKFSISIKYEYMNELENNSDYSFFYRNTENFTPNIPPNYRYASLNNGTWRNFVVSAGVTISPYHKPRGDGYSREYNPYPQIFLNYTLGLPGIFNSNSDFQTIGLTATKRYWLGRNRIFKYQVNSTYWISSKNVFFSDFTQIKTSDIPFTFSRLDNTYQLLPFYTCNTNQWSIGGHVQYQTKLLLLKRLPIISNRIWTENLYFNYLHNPNATHYMELGYGLGQLWAVGEAAVFTSFENFKYRSVGVKVSISVD
jgi:hypothetical protein